MNQAPQVAQLYPPDFRDALVSAGRRGELAVIDMLTDALANRGEVRQRHDDSRAQEWASQRNQWAVLR